MNDNFAARWASYFVGFSVIAAIALSIICSFVAIKFSGVLENPYALVPIITLLVVISALTAQMQIEKEHGINATRLQEEAAKEIVAIAAKRDAVQKESEVWKASLKEKSKGFPTLISAIQEYEALQDEGLSEYLERKRHPAVRAAEIVAEYSRRRRESEHTARVTKSILEYYENMAPFLADLKNDIYEDDKDAFTYDCTDEEKEDPVIRYVSKEEYRRLTSPERNQLALDRYWQRPKSKVHIGRIYERFVGHLYERNGWAVEYTGIFKGYEDLGRDLTCTKSARTVIVQCKYWSQFKTIYEKHIFQFFGTVFQFKDETKNASVQGYFYTTTQVSQLARRFAQELGIQLKEEFAFDQGYPCIKCNINPTSKERIYHLPFDQQYDTTKICSPGEFYCATVAAAENQGFRRAMRWRGDKSG
jgi:hypothetical protein